MDRSMAYKPKSLYWGCGVSPVAKVVGMERDKKLKEWLVPDERDQMECPIRPDLRCSEHCNVCAVIHSLHGRIVALETRITELERKR